MKLFAIFLIQINVYKEEYKITAVGSGANKTIEELGHATIKFDGSPEAENPGTIHVEAKEILLNGENTVLKFIKS